MTERDVREFAEIMAAIAENFGKEISVPGVQLRFDALREYPIGAVKAAAMAIMRSRKYTSMPTIADFVEHLGGGNIADRAAVQATQVRTAIGSHGGYASVCFDDPVTQAVLEEGFGGWPTVCGEYTEANRQWFDREFVRLYVAFSAANRTRVGYLAGRTEIHNLAHAGGRFITPPALVGSPEKARAVLQAAVQPKAVDMQPEPRRSLESLAAMTVARIDRDPISPRAMADEAVQQ